MDSLINWQKKDKFHVSINRDMGKNMKVFLEENGHTVKLVDTYKSIKINGQPILQSKDAFAVYRFLFAQYLNDMHIRHKKDLDNE
ncbi:MAG: hypothetical protein ABW148_18600 [Sedimenticola sp.]